MAEKLNMGGAQQSQAPDEEKAGKPAAKPQTPSEKAHAAIKWYKVKEDCEVPHASGKYLLKKGKIISTKGYDMTLLEEAGVELEEVPEPAWHKRLHKKDDKGLQRGLAR